ncbi:MAG: 3-phosphoshikimate 1-carboxyvinyltransferase, partial [Bacteroidota bacterium]|nr:3-phosphoshikimate 1-carboxyvinyltransferase [Bacteroidota bacterium]
MNHSRITLSHLTGVLRGSVTLPASKSESNRAQIINALSGGASTLENLS